MAWEDSDSYKQLVKQFQNNVASGSSNDFIQQQANSSKAFYENKPNIGMISEGDTYTDKKTGTRLTPYSEGSQYGTVLADSVFDVNNPNTYNAKIANSSGRINLRNEGDYDASGKFTGANSGSKSESDSQAYYNNIMAGGNGSSKLQELVQGSGGQSNSPSYGGSSSSNGVANNSSQISDMYAQTLAASQAALKASIQKSMGTYQGEIAKAPGTYQPLKNNVSFAGEKSKLNLQEMLANSGQQGGVNRTEQTQINSNTENNLNSLEMQQQGVINTANQAIADLQAQGDIKGAELVAQNASERIRAMIEESNRVDSVGYSRGRDSIADTRYNAETAYNQGRDTLADERLAAEAKYRAEQDRINQTGQLSDGTYTQQGRVNETNIKTGELQLRELTDPNSTTNQLAQLGLQTAKLNYASLPQQLQAQAQQVVQELRQGAIDMKTAQIKLDYLPQMMRQEIAQNNAQLSATNRSNTGGGAGGGNSDPNKPASQTEIKKQITSAFNNALANNQGMQWLKENQNNIVSSLSDGETTYKTLLNKASKTQNVVKETTKTRALNNNTTPQY